MTKSDTGFQPLSKDLPFLTEVRAEAALCGRWSEILRETSLWPTVRLLEKLCQTDTDLFKGNSMSKLVVREGLGARGGGEGGLGRSYVVASAPGYDFALFGSIRIAMDPDIASHSFP